MERMTLSDTWVVRISGVTPWRFSTRMMSSVKPMEGIRNSLPVNSSTGNALRPPLS